MRPGYMDGAEVSATWTYAGRWALVTGASSGIGEAFARALAQRGMHVALTARREERLRELAEELRSRHRIETAVVAADLAEPDGPAAVWRQAAAGRTIHLLVNNAGFGLGGSFSELPRERQREMVALNCGALLELAHLALGEMLQRGEGGIVNVASTAAFQPVPKLATYAATKAFVLSLSEALWAENRDSGVRVLALCPGTVPTEFQEVAGMSRGRGSPGQKTPEEVVRAALRALEADEDYVVPGALNRAGAALSRMAPLGLVTRVAARVIERIG